ncbi:MAG: OmpA family protein, partial [Haliea sp.]
MTAANNLLKPIILIVLIAPLLVACATSPSSPDGAEAARAKLLRLQGEQQLARLAPVEIQDAEQAVTLALQPEENDALAAHRVLLADQKVDIARAWAQSRLYENQRVALSAQQDRMLLDARTREANVARNDANSARADAIDARRDAADARNAANAAQEDANRARSDADGARTDASIARAAADDAQTATALARNQANIARQQLDDMQLEIDALNARDTDRGLVLTLGDFLFETGGYELRENGASALDELATFLNRYEDRTVIIEGHTDDVGDYASNLSLSQRRAEAVRTHLLNSGIAAHRLQATGKGETSPVSANDSAT